MCNIRTQRCKGYVIFTSVLCIDPLNPLTAKLPYLIHPFEVVCRDPQLLRAQLSLYVHKGGVKPHTFHFPQLQVGDTSLYISEN